MKRRGFLGLLGSVAAAPLLVLQRPLGTASIVPDSYMSADQQGTSYRHIQAHKDLAVGDFIWNEKGLIVGIAMSAIPKHGQGWMMVSR